MSKRRIRQYALEIAGACWQDVETYLITPEIRKWMRFKSMPKIMLVQELKHASYDVNKTMLLPAFDVENAFSGGIGKFYGGSTEHEIWLKECMYHENVHHIQNALRWHDMYEQASEATADLASAVVLAAKVSAERAQYVCSKLLDDARVYGKRTGDIRRPLGMSRVRTKGRHMERLYASGFPTAYRAYEQLGMEPVLLYPFKNDEDADSYIERVKHKMARG